MITRHPTLALYVVVTDYFSILSALVPVLLMVAVGFLAHRAGWIAAKAEQGLFRLTINVLVPCLIFESVAARWSCIGVASRGSSPDATQS